MSAHDLVNLSQQQSNGIGSCRLRPHRPALLVETSITSKSRPWLNILCLPGLVSRALIRPQCVRLLFVEIIACNLLIHSIHAPSCQCACASECECEREGVVILCVPTDSTRPGVPSLPYF
jgi:hypothetical protein